MADEETPHNAADLFGSDEDEELFDSNNNIAAEADDEAQLGAQPASQPTARERLEALAGKKRREQEEAAAQEEAAHASKRHRTSDIPEQEDLFGEDDDDDADAPQAAPPIDQEYDGEGQATEADRAFIDDTEADPDDMGAYAGDDDAPMYRHEEAEEGDEFERMMEERKKRRNKGMSDMEIREYVENLIDKLEAAHEEDKQYLEEKKPAINRLAALSDFEQAVARPQLHRWLLDAGILAVFNHWLYPHSNGTLPNIRLRTSLLKMLTRLNIDTSLEHRRDQVKRSGVGKVVLFYAKLGDETAGNRKMAAALVERWTKPVYEQFGRRDRSQPPDEDAERMRELKRAQAAREEAAMAHFANPNAKPGDKGFRWHARIPQAARLDYIKRPQADPQLAAMAAAPKAGRAAQPAKLEKKLKVLSGKKDTGRAANVSVEGRGLTL